MCSKISKEKNNNLSRSFEISVWVGRRRRIFRTNDVSPGFKISVSQLEYIHRMYSKISKEINKNLSRYFEISVWVGRRRRRIFRTNDVSPSFEILGAQLEYIHKMYSEISKKINKNLSRYFEISVWVGRRRRRIFRTTD
jgi:hypothetical protein